MSDTMGSHILFVLVLWIGLYGSHGLHAGVVGAEEKCMLLIQTEVARLQAGIDACETQESAEATRSCIAELDGCIAELDGKLEEVEAQQQQVNEETDALFAEHSTAAEHMRYAPSFSGHSGSFARAVTAWGSTIRF
jgi:hypothetical protein